VQDSVPLHGERIEANDPRVFIQKMDRIPGADVLTRVAKRLALLNRSYASQQPATGLTSDRDAKILSAAP